jgi:hypothetical protein
MYSTYIERFYNPKRRHSSGRRRPRGSSPSSRPGGRLTDAPHQERQRLPEVPENNLEPGIASNCART